MMDVVSVIKRGLILAISTLEWKGQDALCSSNSMR